MNRKMRRSLPALPKQFRTVDLDVRVVERDANATADEPATYEISFTSEARVQRWWGVEILSHAKGAVDLSYMKKDGAILVDHDPCDLVGVARTTVLDEQAKMTRSQVQFSRSARGQEIEQDVKDRIRTRSSGGYIIRQAKLVKQGETMEQDEWLVTKWALAEGSIVGIPADLSVGVGRSAEAGETFAVEIEGGASAEEERSMKPCKICGLETCAHTNEERESGVALQTRSAGPSGGNPAAAAAAAPAGGVAVSDARDLSAEFDQIMALAERHKMTDKVRSWVQRKLTPQQVGAEILDGMTTAPLAQPGSERAVQLGKRDADRYSWSKAILESASERGLTGLEKEVNDDIVRKLPDGYKRRERGIFVPLRLRELTAEQIERRTLATNAPGAGAELVPTQRGEYIDLLRNRLVVAKSGASVLTGVQGIYEWVKQIGGTTAYVMGENPGANVTKSQPTLSVVGSTPRTMMACVPFTRQQLVQSSPDVEALVQNDIAEAHALLTDYLALFGAGVANEPEGIYNAAGVQVATMGGQPDFPKLTAMTALPATKNAGELSSPGWITNSSMAGVLLAKPKAAVGGTSGYCMDGNVLDGTIAGFPAKTTMQIPNTMSGSAPTGGAQTGMIFGFWKELFLLYWAAMEIVTNPYSRLNEGIIECTSFQMFDNFVRRAEAFAKTTDATL